MHSKSSEYARTINKQIALNTEFTSDFTTRTAIGSFGVRTRPRTSIIMKPRTASVIENFSQPELIGTEYNIHNDFKKRRQKSAASHSSYRKHSMDKRSTENSTSIPPLNSLDCKKI